MKRKARIWKEDGTVLEIFFNDPKDWIHKDLYNSLVEISSDVNVGDRIDPETGEKIIKETE